MKIKKSMTGAMKSHESKGGGGREGERENLRHNIDWKATLPTNRDSRQLTRDIIMYIVRKFRTRRDLL